MRIKFPAAIANKFGRQILKMQKSSPQVMFGAGIVGIVGATVLACRSTLQLSDVLEESALQAQAAENLKVKDSEYAEKSYAKDVSVIKAKTLIKITKLYAPSVGLGILSIGLLTGSHVVLNRRNASLTAAYAAVDQAFQQYRERVREQLGEDNERELRYGSRVVEETVEGKNGPKTVKHVRVADGEPSLYARFFDELCPDWQRNPEFNSIFLHAQQRYFNDMLQARGHVFLNEVYDALGLPRSSAGQVVGWVISKDGDNFVDFGIFDNIANDKVRDFVNGREAAILLDFNVDGVIYDQI